MQEMAIKGRLRKVLHDCSAAVDGSPIAICSIPDYTGECVWIMQAFHARHDHFPMVKVKMRCSLGDLEI